MASEVRMGEWLAMSICDRGEALEAPLASKAEESRFFAWTARGGDGVLGAEAKGANEGGGEMEAGETHTDETTGEATEGGTTCVCGCDAAGELAAVVAVTAAAAENAATGALATFGNFHSLPGLATGTAVDAAADTELGELDTSEPFGERSVLSTLLRRASGSERGTAGLLDAA